MKAVVGAWTKANVSCGVALAILTVALILSPLLAPTVLLPLDPKSVNAESGYAYTVALRLPDALMYTFPSDSGGDASSRLVVLEDGSKLGPAHASHDSIRMSGRGRFSHWGSSLYFSASDNSDPRANGRSYAARATATVAPWVTVLILALNAVFLVAARKSLIATLRRQWDGSVRVLAGAAVVAALLMAAGVFGGPFYQPADAALVADVARHVLLAVILVVAQWIVGAGIARLMLPKRGTSYAQVVLLGFPASLVASAILAAVALLLPFGGALALGVAMICALPLALWPLERIIVQDLLRRLPALIVISAAFGSWLALQWHGPTLTLPGSPTGDLTFYASTMWAIAANPQTWPNLGNEGEWFSHFNMLIPTLGAALRSAVEVDGFLFILTVSGVTCMFGMGVAIHAYATARPRFVLWSPEGAAFLLSFVVAGRYPYWIAESPPVAHVVPLTIAVWFWVVESRRGAATPAIGLIVAFVGSLASKVASFVVLGAVAVEACYRLVTRLSRPALVVLGVFGVVTGAYAAMMLIWFLPFFTQISGVTTESLERIFRYGAAVSSVWPYLARDTGCILLAAAAFRILPWPTSAAVAIGFVVGLVFPFVMRVNVMCAVIMLALAYVDEPARLRGSKLLVLTALLLCLPAMILTEPGGAAVGFGWLALVSLVVFVALYRPETMTQLAMAMRPGLVISTSLVVIALALVALARGAMPYIKHDHSEVLSPQVRDIWAAVREQTPREALVFTDQNGKVPTLLAGWNTFAFHGQRQVFHANWYQSGKLRNAPAERDARLAENDDVLSGRRAPSDVPVSRAYSGYYAVVSIGRNMDSHWQSIYANNAYGLYRWTP